MDTKILFLKGGKAGDAGLCQKKITGKDGISRTHWVRLVRPIWPGHDDAQRSLFENPYPVIETRPDTLPEQKKAGCDALVSLQNRINRLRDRSGGGATLLGARLQAGFVANGGNQLIGQRITSPGDLAALAQVYRDPRFETFRVIYLRGDRVVGEAAYSSRLPGAVQLPDDYPESVIADKARFGSDGYYIMHNHPSGRATPSPADINLTIATNEEVQGMLGHVVVDHHEYATITPDGLGVEVHQDPDLSGPDYHQSHSMGHPLLGVQITGRKDAAMAAKALQASNDLGAPVLVMTKGQYAEVDLIASVPSALLQTMVGKTDRAKAWLRGVGRASGAGSNRFLVLSDADFKSNDRACRSLITKGLVTDVVSDSGLSLVKTTSATRGFGVNDVFGTIRGGRKAAEPQNNGNLPMDNELTKALPKRILFFKSKIAYEEPISKPRQVVIFAKSHVKQFTRQDGTVVNEHDDKRTKKATPPSAGHDAAAAEGDAQAKDPEDAGGAANGYGTHNIEEGDSIHFKAGDFEGKGKVKSVGKDGATVEDESGRSHSVHWHEVTGFKGAEGAKKPDDKREVLGPRDPVAPESFSANEWKAAHDDASASEESVLKAFPGDTADKINAAIERLDGIEQTQTKFKEASGEYGADRQALHDQILFGEVDGVDEETGAAIKVPGILAGWKAAIPADGEAPTFTILGGRGGSGKSQFKGLVYDPDKCIVLDADHIKSMLPEYEGWNAATVHEESSDILERALAKARERGLNVVLDATMKTAKSAIAKVQSFKDSGYRTEAHYMHLPRQEAAKRAIARFLGKTARFVPPKVVLENTTNEESFDGIKSMVDAWSFRDNNVKKGEAPILISESAKSPEKDAVGDEKPMQKAIAPAIILLWRKKK